MQKRKAKFRIAPYVFIAPTFILIAIFSYYAMGNGIWMSFTDYRVGYAAQFIGFDNFKKLFGTDGQVFWVSFKNQLLLTLFAVVNSVFWPLLTAELLFFIRNKRISNVIKGMFVVPMLVPGIVVTLIWRFLYNKSFGFNTMLSMIGLQSLQRDWLNDAGTSMAAVIFMGFPFVAGLNFLIFHSAINNVGQDLYEAAIIDGANSHQIAWRIHLPNVTGYINVVATLALIGSLSSFGSIAATTNGGPGNSSTIPSLLMYNVAFGDRRFGYASAMGVIIMVVIMILTFLQQMYAKRQEV